MALEARIAKEGLCRIMGGNGGKRRMTGGGDGGERY